MFLGALGRCTANASSDSRLPAQNYGRKHLQNVIGFFNLLSLVFSSLRISISNNSPASQKEPRCSSLRWELIQGHSSPVLSCHAGAPTVKYYPARLAPARPKLTFEVFLSFLSTTEIRTHTSTVMTIEHAQKCSFKPFEHVLPDFELRMTPK